MPPRYSKESHDDRSLIHRLTHLTLFSLCHEYDCVTRPEIMSKYFSVFCHNNMTQSTGGDLFWLRERLSGPPSGTNVPLVGATIGISLLCCPLLGYYCFSGLHPPHTHLKSLLFMELQQMPVLASSYQKYCFPCMILCVLTLLYDSHHGYV